MAVLEHRQRVGPRCIQLAEFGRMRLAEPVHLAELGHVPLVELGCVPRAELGDVQVTGLDPVEVDELGHNHQSRHLQVRVMNSTVPADFGSVQARRVKQSPAHRVCQYPLPLPISGG